MKTLLSKALTEAGKIQKEYFRKKLSFEQKESISSIVTEVDLMCDKIITGLILQQFPNHNILTEEGGLLNNNSEFTWVIDPLDGTSNFAAGIPWFGVLIAVFKHDQPVLAGAYLPIDDLLYLAETGKGAFLNGVKLEIPVCELKNSLSGFAIDYTDDAAFVDLGMEWYRFLIKNTRNVRSTNSLVDLMLVAEGRLGLAVNLFTKIWDIAAPWLIIREAGGQLKHLTDSELIFDLSNEGLMKNYPVIAGSTSIFDQIAIS